MVPFLAIGAFAGLRTAEIQRLDWSKVNLSTGYITVDAGIAKTNSRRLVPISCNLAEWLRPYASSHGPVVPIENVANAIQRLVTAANARIVGSTKASVPPAVRWRHNVRCARRFRGR